ncbi:MAG: SIMPL domain-containing protein [Geminicoccaceae bacterium]
MDRKTARSFLALGLVLGLGLTTPSAIADDDRLRRITVTGQGEARAAPDIATMSIGVETEAETPSEALAANAARMTAVMKRLKSAGIADGDLRTSQLGIWQVFAEHQQPRDVVAFHATNQLEVTIRAIDRLGVILDEAVADGANNVNGPTFSIADPEPLLAAAREAAVKDAIAKAERDAAAADVTLGKVLSIDEGGGGPVFAGKVRAEAMMARTPVALGENTLTATVTMTFAIRRKARQP